MAQQTINIGASPNDGTGTPLRTAFQYTNSNFSELYTAVGPSGNNIVVPGNATITGDLTVDTSTLKVDSTNNRVGIGTASPGSALDVYGETRVRSGNQLRVYRADNAFYSSIEDAGGGAGLTVNNFNGDGFLLKVASNNVYQVNSSYVQTWYDGAGGTRMTLNSTGLGVGVGPSYKLHVFGASPALTIQDSSSAAGGVGGTMNFISYTSGTSGANIEAQIKGVKSSASSAGELLFFTSDSSGNSQQRFMVDGTGNLGIGVTPSAWFSTWKVLQFGGGSHGGPSDRLFTLQNAIVNPGGDFQYVSGSSTPASGYRQFNGAHDWYTAAAGTSPNTITDFSSPKMTLDASGNLLVGKTASSSTVVGAELRPSGAIISTLAASTNADFALYTYSTGAGAARFYVGMSGTVFATNTTISAISDQRLKENVQDIDVGLGAILALKPRKFDWKEGKGKDIKGDRGFIAQEFEQVFPQLVDEWADPAPEGETPYKSVRQDLIPVLVKAIQELTARVQTLETR